MGDKNRIARLLKDSGLPIEKTLASFDLKWLPAKVARQFKVLLDGSFLDGRENLLRFGSPGAGKSHLLSALGHEMVNRGRRMKHTSCAMLVHDLLAAKRDLCLSRENKKLAQYGELIIDEMGFVRQSRKEMEVLSLCLQNAMNAAAFCSPAISLFQVGGNLQRSDDHGGGGDRSPGPSQHHPRTAHPQLPDGASPKRSESNPGTRRTRRARWHSYRETRSSFVIRPVWFQSEI